MARFAGRIGVGAVASTAFLIVPWICAGQQKATSRKSQEAHYRCDTGGVRLRGMLTARTFYGPPGFGESPDKDAHEEVLILQLTDPITVDPVADESKRSCWGAFPHTGQIQLFIFPPQRMASARKLVGKAITVVGTLREGDAPSEHTKVIMDVKSLDSR